MANPNPAPRFPATSQTPEQAAATAEAERLVTLAFGPSFQLKDAQGNLLGPFSTLSYTPSTLLPFLNYSASFVGLETLTGKERELAVLATCFVTKAEYALYAHQRIGISLGLTEQQAQEASDGMVPGGLEKREDVVYGLALEMAKGFGRLSDAMFESAVGELGRDGVAQLAQVVGGYMLSSMLINVAAVKVPAS